MAVTTLNDLAGALRSDNDAQLAATVRQSTHISNLVEQNASLNAFLRARAAAEDAERRAAAARRVEEDREASAASAAVRTSESSSESSVSGSGSGSGFFGKLLTMGPLGKMIKAVGSVLSTAKKLGRLFLKGGIFGAVIYGVYQIFKDIGENEKFKATIASLKKSWESIKTSWNEIVELFADPQEGSVISRIKNAISGAMDWVASFGEEWEFIRCKIQDAALFIAENVVGGIALALEGVKNFMKDPVGTWNRWTAGIQAGWDNAMTLLDGAWTTFKCFFTDDIPEWFATQRTRFDAWVTGVGETFTKKWEAFSGFFTETIPDWFTLQKIKFDAWVFGVGESFTKKWESFSGFFTKTIPGWFSARKEEFDIWLVDTKKAFTDAWANFKKFFLEDIPGMISGWWDGVKGSDLFSEVKYYWDEIYKFMTVDIPKTISLWYIKATTAGEFIMDFLKSSWDNVVCFFTKDIPKVIDTWVNNVFAVKDSFMDFLKSSWDNVVCFFTKDIPEVVDKWVGKVIKVKDNFMNGIANAWTAVTTFFTETIPTTIKEWIVPDFDLMGNITAKVTNMLTMIFDLIPSMEDIKNSLIKQVRKMGSIGQGILEFFGISAGTEGPGPLTTQQKVELNTKQRTEQGLRPFGPLLGVQAFNPKTGLMQDHNYKNLGNYMASEHDAMSKHNRDMLIPIVERLTAAAEAEKRASALREESRSMPSSVIGSVGDTTTQSSVTYISPERYAYLDMFEAGTGRGPPNTWHLN